MSVSMDKDGRGIALVVRQQDPAAVHGDDAAGLGCFLKLAGPFGGPLQFVHGVFKTLGIGAEQFPDRTADHFAGFPVINPPGALVP